MKKISIAVAIVISAMGLSSCSAKTEFTGADIKKSVYSNESWQILADWNFGANSDWPTRFQGKAYYTKKGSNYLWVDHGMGATIPIKVENGLLYAPTESPVIDGMEITNPIAKKRIKNDLFMNNPLELAIETGAKFILGSDNKYRSTIICDPAVKLKHNCTKLEFELSLDKNKNPETLLVYMWRSPKLHDKVSFYYNMYNEATLEIGEAGVNFANLAPPDYEAMGESLMDEKAAEMAKVLELETKRK